MQSQKTTQSTTIGFIGLGNMGGRMAKNLRHAGYPLIAFDIVPEKCPALADIGAKCAENATDVVTQSDVVLCSLRSSDVFVHVAENELIPNARNGQIFIDAGTTSTAETRRLAEAFAEKDAALIDAPVSGGTHGAETGTLRIFVGGAPKIVQQCRPILDVIGEPPFVVYCGESGAGQIVKGVNQLAMGLGTAAYLEAIAFGVRAGVDNKAIRQAIGLGNDWRAEFDKIAAKTIDGKGKTIVVKFPELPYFLEQAEADGFEIPLTKALYEFCKKGTYRMYDNMKRPSRSFWHELTDDTD